MSCSQVFLDVNGQEFSLFPSHFVDLTMMQTMNRIKQHRIAGRGNEKASFNLKGKIFKSTDNGVPLKILWKSKLLFFLQKFEG